MFRFKQFGIFSLVDLIERSCWGLDFPHFYLEVGSILSSTVLGRRCFVLFRFTGIARAGKKTFFCRTYTFKTSRDVFYPCFFVFN